MPDISQQIAAGIASARADKTALTIVAGNTKHFVGRHADGRALEVASHTGILSYAPNELVLTARAGTTLEEIERTLDARGQMLPFEPPRFGPAATIGGTLACNLSGPRRPWAGSVRDAVLGLKLINGRAEQLRFGGQVMKNVAGFDVSRLQAGALGSFGVISEITVKVLPKPPSTLTLVRESPAGAAIVEMNELARQPKPLTGAAWVAGRLYLRLAGAESAVAGTAAQWGGERLADGDGFWHELNEQRLPFFDPGRPLWRFSVTSTAPLAELDGEWLLDWAGAQRFIHGDFDRTRLESLAMAAGGHVSLFRGGDRNAEVFTELEAPIKRLHLRLKRAFDPDRVLNPGRMYSWL